MDLLFHTQMLSEALYLSAPLCVCVCVGGGGKVGFLFGACVYVSGIIWRIQGEVGKVKAQSSQQRWWPWGHLSHSTCWFPLTLLIMSFDHLCLFFYLWFITSYIYLFII